jgi:predicted  nucleic acid-binding Zn-ribbon protein
VPFFIYLKRRCGILKRWFLVGAILLAALLMVSCGIPQEDYDSVLTERDALMGENTTLKATIDKLELDLNGAENEIQTLENDVAEVEGQIQTLQSDLSDAESDIADALTQIETLEGSLLDIESNLVGAQTQIVTLKGDLTVTEEQLGVMEAALEAVHGELLFYDDFEDGDTEGWDFRGFEVSWSVIQKDNNYLLQGADQQGKRMNASIIDSYDWENYTLEFRINITQIESAMGFWVNFRATQDLSKNYMLGISPTIAQIQKGNPVISEKRWSDPLRGWIDIKIEVYRDNVRVYINEDTFGFFDTEPLERGGINFRVDSQYAEVYLDDVLVTIDNKIPQ